MTELEHRLNALLTDFERHAAWLELPMAPEVIEGLRARWHVIADEITRLLIDLRKAGVTIVLAVPGPSAPPAPTAGQILTDLRERLPAMIDRDNEFDLLATLLEECERWIILPQAVIFATLSFIVARLRHFESIHGRQNERMTAFCDAARIFGKAHAGPNSIRGVFANDKPRKSWAEDAAANLEILLPPP